MTQDVGGALGEYQQFVCKICNLMVRNPLVLPCAHMFCKTCFNDWIQQKKPNVACPTCEQAVRPQEVVHFEARASAGNPCGGALALLHRLYSGMKVRCVYDPDLSDSKALTAEAERAKASGYHCGWRGAMHDYATHLSSCKAHGFATSSRSGAGGVPSSARVAASCPQEEPLGSSSAAFSFQGKLQVVKPPTATVLPSAAPVTPATALRSDLAWTTITGAFQVLRTWHSLEAGTLAVQQGIALWVTSADESGEWAYARLLRLQHGVQPSSEAPPPAWVPRALLQRAVYPACSAFDATGQSQGLTLSAGDLVHVYHREVSGWTYGARLMCDTSDGLRRQFRQQAEVGWFPEACILEPLPIA